MTSLHPVSTGARLIGAVALASLLLTQQTTGLAAQPASRETTEAQSGDARTLAELVRERFDVVPLQSGVGLVPREPSQAVRMIELRNGTVAVNGEIVTGRELVDRLGDSADPILRLSYLDEATLRSVLGVTTEPASPPEDSRAAPPPGPAAEPSRPRLREIEDVVKVGGDVTIDRDERVRGDVVVIGGKADIDGEVTGDLVVIASALTLGPEADVLGDVTIVASHHTRAPGARVRGRLHQVAGGWRDWQFDGDQLDSARQAFMRFGGLILTMLRIGLLMVAGWIVMLFFQDASARVSRRASGEPLKAGVIGLLGELLVFPVLILVIVILAISIIGIPLLVLVPFALLALLLVFVFGFSSVAGGLGGWLARRFGWTLTPVGTVTLGIAVLLAPAFLARLMYVFGGMFYAFGIVFTIAAVAVEFVAWTAGFGAVMLTRFKPEQPQTVAQTAA